MAKNKNETPTPTPVFLGVEIKSKFEIGDELFYWDMRGKIPKVNSFVVSQINTITTKDNNATKVKQCIYYKGWGTENWDMIEEPFKEEHLARTKEELLDLLK